MVSKINNRYIFVCVYGKAVTIHITVIVTFEI